ncbi:hypothetical protein K402DRAFT_464139 [Aulographum hederae CBS 113979]|uniref:Ubiquitin-like domain-containing protein n=1 Tax=Aulographum hederae CBS 113979 TaxID=1176131 RepID=A0A6G1GYJ2_9PEZI|nr:hypothetical protein K402DRAFT_464139 [Aulographum hederae CBS 113979]
METATDSRTIFEAAEQCVERFHECLTQLQYMQDGTGSALVEDQYGRFSIWISNIGVFAPGHASMDYRLREAADIKDLVVRLLDTLLGHIGNRKESHAFVWVHANTDNCTVCDLLLTSQGISAEQELKGASATTFDISSESAQTHLKAVAEDIRILHRLSNTIRKASAESQNIKAASTFEMKDADGIDLGQRFKEHFAAKLLELKFPGASPTLRDRLASAMLLRRKRILYRKSRQVSRPSRIAPKPVPMQMPKPEPRFVPERQVIGEKPMEDRTIIETPLAPSRVNSQPHTATTLDPDRFRKASAPSRISSVKSIPLTQEDELNFPPAPRATAGYECICPYCFLVLLGDEATNPRKWREHVKNDLDPYVCLFEDCDHPLELYKHSEAWLKHMRQEHMLRWRCAAKSHKPEMFETRAAFEEHMRQRHKNTFSEKQLPLLAERSARPTGPTFVECPLCGLSQANEGMENHVVQHLRFIALKSLPWPDDVEDAPSSKASERPKTRTTIADQSEYGVPPIFDGIRRPATFGFQDNKTDDTVQVSEATEMPYENVSRTEWAFLHESAEDERFSGFAVISAALIVSDPILEAFARHADKDQSSVHSPGKSNSLGPHKWGRKVSPTWATHFKLQDDELLDHPGPNIERQKVIHKLIYKEQCFLAEIVDARSRIEDLLYRIIQRGNVKDPPRRIDDPYTSVFDGLDSLITKHTQLVDKLLSRQDEEGPWIQTIADIVLDWASNQGTIDVHVDYAAGRLKAESHLLELLADSTSNRDTQITFNVNSYGTKYVLTLPCSTTVADVKAALASPSYSSIPTERQWLISFDRTLSDRQTLKEAKVQDGHTIHLVNIGDSNTNQNPANSGNTAESTTQLLSIETDPFGLLSLTMPQPIKHLKRLHHYSDNVIQTLRRYFNVNDQMTEERQRLRNSMSHLETIIEKAESSEKISRDRIDLTILLSSIVLPQKMKDLVNLDLNSEHRQLFFQSDLFVRSRLQSSDGNDLQVRIPWVTKHVILLDNYLIMATEINSEEGSRYELSDFPIPIQLLSLHRHSRETIFNQSRPRTTVNFADLEGEYGNYVAISHLGKRDYDFSASSEMIQTHFTEAIELARSQLVSSRRIEPFTLKVVAGSENAYKYRPRFYIGPDCSPLFQALTRFRGALFAPIGKISCAVAFNLLGVDSFLFLGTSEGLSLHGLAQPGADLRWHTSDFGANIKQVAILSKSKVVLLNDDGLYTFSFSDVSLGSPASVAATKKTISENRNIDFFYVDDESNLLFYKVRSGFISNFSGPSSTIKILQTDPHAPQNPKSQPIWKRPFINPTKQHELFPELTEYTLRSVVNLL